VPVGLSAQSFVLLGSAVVPPALAIAVYWFGWRWAKRHDDDEHG
jgi:hypothetical protein